MYCSIRIFIQDNKVVVKPGVNHGDGSSNGHNHDIQTIDSYKINSAIRSALAQEVGKGYPPSVVAQNVRGVHNEAARETLDDAGGHWITRHTVVNQGRAWRRNNPDERRVPFEGQGPEQAQELIRWLENHPGKFGGGEYHQITC